MPALTKEVIEAAIQGFEQQKTKIDEQIAELRAMLPGTSAPDGSRTKVEKPKRTMSASGRRAIAEAQRKRWAAARGETASAPKRKSTKQTKRKLSPEGKAAIVAALKKRWAAKKANS